MAWEFVVDGRGPLHKMVDIACPRCGDLQVLMPQAMLVMLIGQHLPCPECLQESATCVARVVEVSE